MIGSVLEVCNDLITHTRYYFACGEALTAALRVTGRQFELDASEIGRSSYSEIQPRIHVCEIRVTAYWP